MHAVLVGFAAVAPRSALPNLIEILGTLLTKASDIGGSGGATQWMNEILMSVRHHHLFSNHFCDSSLTNFLLQDDFVPSKAGPDAKTKFIKAVAG